MSAFSDVLISFLRKDGNVYTLKAHNAVMELPVYKIRLLLFLNSNYTSTEKISRLVNLVITRGRVQTDPNRCLKYSESDYEKYFYNVGIWIVDGVVFSDAKEGQWKISKEIWEKTILGHGSIYYMTEGSGHWTFKPDKYWEIGPSDALSIIETDLDKNALNYHYDL